jgi:hypothetical protein
MATTAFNLAKLMEEIDAQKRTYHEKTLTADAEWNNYLRYLHAYDMFVNWSSFLIPQFVFNATSLIAILGIDPIEIDIFKLAFDISTPSLDEILKGVNIKIDTISVDIALDMYNIPKTAFDFIQQTIKAQGPAGEKCVYGKSTYGRCYVDPDAVREFINNAILAMYKKHKDVVSFRNEVDAMAKALGVSPTLVSAIFNRIMLINSYYRSGFILNISTLDKVALAYSSDKIPVYTFDGTVVEVGVQYLTDALIGCVLDLFPLDYCFVVPPRSALTGDLEVEQYTPPLIDSIHRIIKSNISRYMYTPMALANYATGRERADYKLSQRVELWGQLMAYRYALDALVESYIQSLLPDADVVTISMYVSAVRQLFGHIYKRHGWGMRLWNMLDDEKLKIYWAEYWSAQGLDYNVLSALFDYVIDVVRHLAKRKYDTASSARRNRLLSALS